MFVLGFGALGGAMRKCARKSADARGTLSFA